MNVLMNVGCADCKAWTRIKKKTKFNKKGECWMRDFVPQTKACSFCNSGTKASKFIM